MKYFVKKNKNKLNIISHQKYSLNYFDNYNNAVEDIVFSKSIFNRFKWLLELNLIVKILQIHNEYLIRGGEDTILENEKTILEKKAIKFNN